MASFNIRLTRDDEQAIARLQRENVNVSQLFRDAVAAADAERRSRSRRLTVAQMRDLFAKIDAIEGPPPDWQGVDVAKREEAQEYLRSKRSLREKRYEVFGR